MDTEEALRCVDDGESGIIGIVLAAEVRKLRAELSNSWQQSFYNAQDTIEIQKQEIAVLQSLVPHPGDGSCQICGCVPATEITLCLEHIEKLAE